MSFQKLSIEEYQALLESKKSTPSGGSALALTLETAASLCLMVCNLTVNKKGYEEIKDKIIEMINEITLIKEEAKKLMDEDSIAFDRLMNAFKEKNGSIICRDILKTAEVGGAPSPRTPEYYQERPCDRCVRTASEILEEIIA